jgi:ATP-binding cassette, subfamily F, member 3
LRQFEGTLIFISHDVHFIRQLSNHVVRVEAGQLRHFTGGYQYYLDKTAQSARAALTSSSFNSLAEKKTVVSTVDRKEQKRIEAEQRQARSRKKQEIQKRISALEKEIPELEAKEKELAAELEKPESYSGGRATQINRELMHIHERMAEANAEWESAGTELAQMEN